MSADQWSVKDRPRRLEDYAGQPSAVAHVRGMVRDNVAPNCILIHGPTGTGKTTLGRIIGNLFSGWKGDPDHNPDLYEMPGNVERTIDDVRRVIAMSRYSPRGGKRRIMIIDEVQGIVGPAGSALLKETEDAAPKTTWILCTDQPFKLKGASQNRAQSIKLDAVPAEAITKELIRVAKINKAALGPKPLAVVQTIAKMSNGCVREAVQILEAVHRKVRGGGNVSDALKSAISSAPGAEQFTATLALLQALLSGNEEQAARAIATSAGADGMVELLNMMLTGLIYKKAGGNPTDGAGWAAVRSIRQTPSLNDMLVLQARVVAALNIRQQYMVPSSSILFGLCARRE